jgi:hypothetical protein
MSNNIYYYVGSFLTNIPNLRHVSHNGVSSILDLKASQKPDDYELSAMIFNVFFKALLVSFFLKSKFQIIQILVLRLAVL